MFSQTKNVRNNMHVEFNQQFELGKKFDSFDDLKMEVKTFGEKYNVVFSIQDSHPGKGQFSFICKHGGIKRIASKSDIADDESIEIIDLTSTDEKIVTEVKKPYKKNTQKIECPAMIRLYNWKVTANHMEHNHPIPRDVTTYAIHRKQPPAIMEKIFTILASGHKDPVTSVMDTLKALKINNVIKKDIQNIQTLFLKCEDGKEMYSLINHLENLEYVVRIQVNEKQEIKGLFFVNEAAIKEARLWPEAITIDATYKTNAHKFSLVNIIGTSNTTSTKSSGRLQTFAIAAAFVNSETEETYTWILEELREAVWPTEAQYNLPSVFVTDNEQALRNAIETVFPESQHLLCSWHLWNTMETKLPIGSIDGDEYRYRRAQAEVAFQKAVSSCNEKEFQKAIGDFQQLITTSGYFANDGATALKYLKDVLMKDDEIKRWAGMFANQHSHMGNRTSSRVESFHSGLKRAIGNQSAAKLAMVAKRMHSYYNEKRMSRYRKLEKERLSVDSLTFDRTIEYRYKQLRFKVVQFAMNKIRENTITSMEDNFVAKGENCNCWDRIRYLLPCPCVISRNPGELPLEIVHKRWRFEHDQDFAEIQTAVNVENIKNQDNVENEAERRYKTTIEEESEDECNIEEDLSYSFPLHDDLHQNKEYNSTRPILTTNLPGNALGLLVYIDENFENNKERMLFRVESLLHKIYNSIKSYPTQQEIADAIKILEETREKIESPDINITLVRPPSTNPNVKGRKSEKGVKGSTKRLEIYKEKFEKNEEKNIKKKKKEDKKKEENEKKKRQYEIENMHLALQQKKRRLTVVMKDEKGSLIYDVNTKKENHPEIKVESSVFDRIDTYNDSKKDDVYRYLNIEPLSAISAIHSVGADGNCGFRAVSFDVYNDQTKWRTVKADMLNTYEKYENSLYKDVSLDPVVAQFEKQRMLKRLQSTRSPCLDDQELWFTNYSCPQIVADTYERPVIVYCYNEYKLKETGTINPVYESQIFFPLIHMQATDLHRPITLLLAFSHFYYVEFGHTPTGRLKKFTKPNLNMDHNRLRNTFKDICNQDIDYAILF